MPFSKETKRRMFERCLRLCCICLKPCGIKIEAAHIVDEAKGGSNDEKNGIPVCFDHHAEIGHYRETHPRGNKYTAAELRNLRDRVYKLVESGAMYAMLIAARVREQGGGAIPSRTLKAPTPTPEAKELLDLILSGDTEASRGGKLKMLDEEDRSLLIDNLIAKAHLPAVMKGLMNIATSRLISSGEQDLIVSRSARRVSLFGNAHAKAAFLDQVPQQTFLVLPHDVRGAFFEDVIDNVEADQYDVVNSLVPALEKHVAAVPEEIHDRFVLALLKQARSTSWHGAPAATRMLKSLPQDMAAAGIAALNVQYLLWNGGNDAVRAFVKRYQNLATAENRRLIRDYVSLTRRAFDEKYETDSPDDI